MVGTQKFLSMQICDYGLAKWLPEQWTHLTISEFEGTFGFVERNIFLFLISIHQDSTTNFFVSLQLFTS